NCEVYAMPGNFSQKTKDCELSMNYEQKDGRIICKVSIVFNSLLISREGLEEWNTLAKNYLGQRKQIVVLKQKSLKK
ncbi:MAG: hypothetical protein O9353_14665, partial [Bacteroidia bacterium]|nr:hypothetical protein [Bacteroidia bacterium]